MVVSKITAYRQQSIAARRYLKLASKFHGLFQDTKKISAVAYKLKLLAGARMHLVFHVSLLKKKIGPAQQLTLTVPELDSNNHCWLEPAAVLKR